MGQGMSGGGGIPGMGFLQMFMNSMGGDNGGGGGNPLAPPTAGNPPASPDQGANPLFKQNAGYSQPMPLFGNMSDSNLAAYMKANGIRSPQGPK